MSGNERAGADGLEPTLTDDGGATGAGAREPAASEVAMAATVALKKPRPEDAPESEDFPGLVEVSAANYVPGGEVARGGMGRIAVARDRRLGRDVAIKELIEHTPERAARFEREARITARLQHPSIVNVHEAGLWPSGQPFFAMKMVSGQPLDDALKETESLDDRLALLPRIISVAEAMAYAHGQHIIHRDLKPSNILLGEYGETVVIDWGLAKDLEDPSAGDASSEAAGADAVSGQLTIAGAVMGTPAYMAPEQAEGKEVDERTDVFALGALLYHTLSGVPPFSGDSADEIIQRAAAGSPRALRDRQPGIPDDLQTIVAKAMHRDPAQRYPTAVELAEDLHRFRRGQLVAAHTYSRSQLVLRWLRRHAAIAAVSALALIVAATSLSYSVVEILDERDQARRARRDASARADEVVVSEASTQARLDPVRALELLSGLSDDGNTRTWRQARLAAIAAESAGLPTVVASGDLSSFDFTAGGEGIVALEGGKRLVALSPQGARRQLYENDRELTDAVLSPARDRVAIGSSDGGIRVLRVSGGGKQLLRGHEGPIASLRFFPDGERLVSSSLDGSVRVWNVAMLSSIKMTAPESMVSALAVSPTGDRVAGAAIGSDIRVWDAETGEVIAEYAVADSDDDPQETAVFALEFSPDGERLAAGGRAGGAVWELKTGSRTELPDGDGSIYDLEFTDEGMLLTGGAGRVVRVWTPELELSQTLHGHDDALAQIGCSDSGDVVSTLDQSGEIRVWRRAGSRYRPLMTLPAGSDGAGLAMSADGSRVAALRGGSLRLWRSERSVPRFELAEQEGVEAVSFSRDDQNLTVLRRDGVIDGFDLASRERSTLSAPSGYGHAAPLGAGTVLTVDRNGTVVLHRGDEEVTLNGRARWKLAISPNLRVAAAPGLGDVIKLWDLETGEARVLPDLGADVTTVEFSADGRWLAAAVGTTTHLWNLESGEHHVHEDHSNTVTWVAPGDRGRCVVTGSDDGTVKLRDLTSDRSIVLAEGLGWVAALESRGECDVVAWLGGERHIGIRVGDAEPTALEPGLSADDLALSADGTFLAAIDRADGVHLWDTATRSKIVLGADEGEISSIAFSHRGARLAAVSRSVARVWSLEIPESPEGLRAWIAERLEQVR